MCDDWEANTDWKSHGVKLLFFLLQCSIIIRYKGAAILEIHFDISIDEMLFELCFEII